MTSAPESREELSWIEMGPEPDGDVATVVSPVTTGYAVSGTHLPGLGWVEAATVAGLLKTLPLDVARAVLDADTGTLTSHTTSAYRPPAAMREFVTTRDGTCRMWGCSRRADHVDLDHTRPWPTGPTTPVNLAGLCRTTPPHETDRPLALHDDRRRHHHLDLHHRPHPHHRTPAPPRVTLRPRGARPSARRKPVQDDVVDPAVGEAQGHPREVGLAASVRR